MEHLDRIVKLAENEFKAIADNGKFRSREEIDSVYKLMDIVKDSMEIECMEEDMYSEAYDGGMSYRDGRSYRGSYNDGSYARGRNQRRDSMGRYSREPYRDGRSMRGYSGDYVDQLRDMMEQAPTEEVRQNIKRMIDTMQ